MSLLQRFVNRLERQGRFDRFSDELYIKIMYFGNFGKWINLKKPKEFNEKIQWLKLHQRNPEYTDMVDKYAVKQYVTDRVGKQYVIPTYGVWDSVDAIDFDALPEQFVLKTTHDCGGVVICKNRSKLDIAAAKEKLRRHMGRNYYLHGREWPYKNVKPRILAEAYMQDGENLVLPVYKVFNFGGEPKIIQAIQNDKTKDETIDYFDADWNLLDLRQNFPNSAVPLEKPQQLEQMLQLSKKLSQGFPFIRTDWYVINGELYFSEYTFFSDSGLARFEPKDWDEKLGSWIRLPENKNTV